MAIQKIGYYGQFNPRPQDTGRGNSFRALAGLGSKMLEISDTVAQQKRNEKADVDAQEAISAMAILNDQGVRTNETIEKPELKNPLKYGASRYNQLVMAGYTAAVTNDFTVKSKEIYEESLGTANPREHYDQVMSGYLAGMGSQNFDIDTQMQVDRINATNMTNLVVEQTRQTVAQNKADVENSILVNEEEMVTRLSSSDPDQRKIAFKYREDAINGYTAQRDLGDLTDQGLQSKIQQLDAKAYTALRNGEIRTRFESNQNLESLIDIHNVRNNVNGISSNLTPEQRELSANSMRKTYDNLQANKTARIEYDDARLARMQTQTYTDIFAEIAKNNTSDLFGSPESDTKNQTTLQKMEKKLQEELLTPDDYKKLESFLDSKNEAETDINTKIKVIDQMTTDPQQAITTIKESVGTLLSNDDVSSLLTKANEALEDSNNIVLQPMYKEAQNRLKDLIVVNQYGFEKPDDVARYSLAQGELLDMVTSGVSVNKAIAELTYKYGQTDVVIELTRQNNYQELLDKNVQVDSEAFIDVWVQQALKTFKDLNIDIGKNPSRQTIENAESENPLVRSRLLNWKNNYRIALKYNETKNYVDNLADKEI